MKRGLSSQENLGGKFENLTAEIARFASRALLRHRMEKVLKSLHFNQISHRLGTIPKAHESTFQWSLYSDRTSLPDWLRSGSGIYWIEGKAGSGKSTLMKYLTRENKTIELLHNWAQDRPLVIVKHFFWGPGSDLQRGLDGLFRTMLFQILMEHPELIAQICPQRVDESRFRYLESWTLEELKGCFQALTALPSLPSKFCFFIDGLDEYRGNPEELIAIINFIAKSVDMKLCVSSRPWVEFRQAFGHLKWQLHVHDLTHDDIARYVQDNLARSEYYQALKIQHVEDAESFQTEIASRAKGVFFWVYLVTRSLVKGLQHQDDMLTLRRRLAAFPIELEDYFMTMLKSIDPIHQEESSEVLSILAYSQANVSVRVLRACLDMHKIAESVDHVATLNRPPISANRETLSSICSSLGNSMNRYCGSSLSNRDTENDLRTANAIAERCKDLVFVYKESEISREDLSIGFLHRSVADFLALSQVDALLKSRVRRGFDARLALARAYMVMMKYEMKGVRLAGGLNFDAEMALSPRNELQIDTAEMLFLKALYETLQLKASSKAHHDRAVLFIAFCFINEETELLSKSRDALADVTYSKGPARFEDLTYQGDSGLENFLSGPGQQLPNLFKQCFRHMGCYFMPDEDHQTRGRQLGGRLVSRLGLEVPFDRDLFEDCSKGPINLPTERLLMLTDSLNKQLVITISDTDEPKLEELDTIDLARLEEIVSISPLSDATSASTFARNRWWIACLQQITRLDGDTWPVNLFEAVEILILRGAPRYVFLKEDFDVDQDTYTTPWMYGSHTIHHNATEEEIWMTAKVETRDISGELTMIRVDSARLLEQIPVIASRSPNGMEDMFTDENPLGELPWLDPSLAASRPSLFRSGQAFFKYLFP